MMDVSSMGHSDNPSWLYVEAAGGVDASGFNLSAGIFQSDSLGNKGNMIGSPLAVSGISNPDLLNTPAAYFFFGADNQSARALDNFQITVPEPSSFPLVCFFAFVHVIFRNRKR